MRGERIKIPLKWAIMSFRGRADDGPAVNAGLKCVIFMGSEPVVLLLLICGLMLFPLFVGALCLSLFC